jgi:hypothetical protein
MPARKIPNEFPSLQKSAKFGLETLIVHIYKNFGGSFAAYIGAWKFYGKTN